ncbi:hypothetical protein A9Q87_10130 [Flavobacteriales bacterium 34_180_T64]|mgnify:CR=1 FL=1|nr:hypothetical protein A9Q87_10130 [Flavobacteriales bacterium 34_180_T64]
MKTIFKFFLVSLLISFASCEKSEISNENDFLEAESRESIDAKGCETAFAYDKEGICFIDDDDLNSNRWGWSIGPLSAPFNGAYDIYQGAGRCDLDNGELVGTLKVSYQLDGTVSVDYEAFEGFGFYETHLFIGDEKFPRKNNGSFTVAPGQYPYGDSIPDGTDLVSYSESGFSGDIYIIAHSVVCYYEKKDDDKGDDKGDEN